MELGRLVFVLFHVNYSSRNEAEAKAEPPQCHFGHSVMR